jgi:hypothetical protein
MWLVGALIRKGAPEMPKTWDPWRVSSFWICASLALYLSTPIPEPSLEDTRITLLLRVHMFVSGLHMGVDEANFLDRLILMQQAVPEASLAVCADLMLAFMTSPQTCTPEITNEAFERIITVASDSDVRAFAKRIVQGERSYRLARYSPPSGAGLEGAFLANLPPTPRVSLEERSLTGAAYLSERSLEERFAHIFRYPSTLWDQK